MCIFVPYPFLKYLFYRGSLHFRKSWEANLVIACSLLFFCAAQKELATYLYESLLSVPNVRIYGPAPSQTDHRAPLCSFNVDNVHPTDIAEILDLQVS